MRASCRFVMAVIVGLAAPLTALAETPTVLRGDAAQAEERGGATAGAPTILRGEPAPRPDPPARPPRVARALTPAGAGDRLWLVDREDGRVGVCRLRETSRINHDVIDCFSRRLDGL